MPQLNRPFIIQQVNHTGTHWRITIAAENASPGSSRDRQTIEISACFDETVVTRIFENSIQAERAKCTNLISLYPMLEQAGRKRQREEGEKAALQVRIVATGVNPRAQ